MRKECLLAIFAVVAAAGFGSGCGDEEAAKVRKRQADDIAAIRAILSKQGGDVSELRKSLEAGTAVKPKEAASEQDQLFDAALLLVKRGPDSMTHQGISMLAAVGGLKKAEPVLMEMLETVPPHKSGAILDALANMGSKKVRDVIIRFLTEGDDQQVNAAVNVLNNNRASQVFGKEDVALFEKILARYPSSDYNNGRYRRNSIIKVIFRLDEEKGVDILCKDLSLPSQPYMRREMLYGFGDNKPLRLESWKKIMKAVGDIDAGNIEMAQPIVQGMARSGDWRVTDIILPMAALAKENNNFRHTYVDALCQLRDPKAAKTLTDLCNLKDNNPNSRRNIDNYPGIKKSETGAYSLVDAAEMKKLLDAREKKIARLNAAEEEQKTPKDKKE